MEQPPAFGPRTSIGSGLLGASHPGEGPPGPGGVEWQESGLEWQVTANGNGTVREWCAKQYVPSAQSCTRDTFRGSICSDHIPLPLPHRLSGLSEPPLEPKADTSGHNLQNVLRQEWAAFSTSIEGTLQEHLNRQELLMNQQAMRLEGIVNSMRADDYHFNRMASKESARTGTTELIMNLHKETLAAGTQSESSHHTCAILKRPGTFCPSPLCSPTTSRGLGKAPTSGDASMSSPRPESKARSSGGLGDNISTISLDEKLTMSTIGGHSAMKSYKKKRSLSILLVDNIQTRIEEEVHKHFGGWIDWFLALEEPPRSGYLAAAVDSRWFEFMSALVIGLNTASTVYTTNFEARSMSEDRSFTMEVADKAFVVYYSLEIFVKMLVHRGYYFINEDQSWNIFDFILVVLAIYDTVFSATLASDNINMSHMRTMRVLRLAKILRMVRLMRFFSELRLILQSVMGSIFSLFWSIVMLVFMFFIFSLVFVQGATIALMNNAENEIPMTPEEIEALRTILGSTERGMLMLFKSATGGDDWTNYYRSIEQTGAGNCALFLFFIAFAQFALLNILTGMYVENAMKLAQPDRDTVALQRRKKELDEAEELRNLCRFVDTTRTGYITQEQFQDMLQNDHFKARLSLLGLDVKDAELFFEVVCSGYDSKSVEIEAFVSGAMRLKGTASSLDMQALTFGTKLIHANQIKFHKDLEHRVQRVLDALGHKEKWKNYVC